MTNLGLPADTEVGVLTAKDFGDAWPLTVEFVFVYCRPLTIAHLELHVAYLVAPDGKQYAVNGTAQAHTKFPRIDLIWADHATGAGLKKDISPIITAALDLCK